MKYIGVSDCKMQEGSLRCDVNVSVKEKGSDKLGTRTEIKNMNSFTFMRQAMEYEFDRQVDLIESGEEVIQETRRFNTGTGETESMRSKEDAHDYRYFREPDLVTIYTPDEEIEEIKATLPELPDNKKNRYISDYEISETDAKILVKYRKVSEFFDAVAKEIKKPKTVSNFIISSIYRTLSTDAEKEQFDIKVSAENMIELIKLLEDGKINMNLCKSTLDKMLETGSKATELIDESQMGGVDESELKAICEKVVAANPKAVEDIKGGKGAAIGALIGGVMKETRGKADAQTARKIIMDLIK